MKRTRATAKPVKPKPIKSTFTQVSAKDQAALAELEKKLRRYEELTALAEKSGERKACAEASRKQIEIALFFFEFKKKNPHLANAATALLHKVSGRDEPTAEVLMDMNVREQLFYAAVDIVSEDSPLALDVDEAKLCTYISRASACGLFTKDAFKAEVLKKGAEITDENFVSSKEDSEILDRLLSKAFPEASVPASAPEVRR